MARCKTGYILSYCCILCLGRRRKHATRCSASTSERDARLAGRVERTPVSLVRAQVAAGGSVLLWLNGTFVARRRRRSF